MGYRCPTCEESKAKYENGHYVCQNDDCGAIWWGAFDKPSAGSPGRGYPCKHCQRNTLHWTGQIDSVHIYRCSICGFAQLESSSEEKVPMRSQ